ncbi:MAG: hypothetical protein ACP5OR_02185 [Candidatus Dormibacteria bacterium]
MDSIAAELHTIGRTARFLLGMLLLAGCTVCIAVLRSPATLLAPHFFAEDGSVWYANAYNAGWLATLVLPYHGMNMLLPRLTAAASLLLPLKDVPVMYFGVSIALRLVVVGYVASDRLADAVPSRLTRYAMCIIYLVLPNSWEVNASMSNSMWHLAVLGILVIIAAPPHSRGWRIADGIAIACVGLTGPFAIACLPCAGVVWLLRRTRWSSGVAIAFGCATLLQLSLLAQRFHGIPMVGDPGALPSVIAGALAGQVAFGGLVGAHGYELIHQAAWWSNSTIQAAIAAVVVFILGWIAARHPKDLGIIVVYGLGIFIAGIVNVSYLGVQSHISLTAPYVGSARYAFVLIVSFLWGLAILVTMERILMMKCLAGILIMVVVGFGIPGDWQYPVFPAPGYNPALLTFTQATKGTAVSIPIAPEDWSMVLIKH